MAPFVGQCLYISTDDLNFVAYCLLAWKLSWTNDAHAVDIYRTV